MKIITLDPGVTTGYCLSVIDDDKVYVAPGQEQFIHEELWRFLLKLGPHESETSHFVCESFEYRKHQETAILYSLEMIGVAKLVAQLSGIRCHMQTAAQGKGYVTDAKLQEAGIYVPGKPHSMDATRHFMHWFMFARGSEWNHDQPYLLVSEAYIRDRFSS